MKSAFSFGLVCLLTPTGCRGLKIRGKTIKLMFKQTTILMKSTLTTIGRLLYAIPFAIFGLFHFMNAEAMAPMVPVPGGVFWVYLVGVALIAAAASIAMRKKSGLASMLLGALLLVFVLTIHLPAVLGGDQMSMGQLLKDLALAGASFYYSGTVED